VGRPVFFDHDGSVDDFLSLLLLLSYDDVDLLGVSVTPADTMIEAAVPATRKILDLAGRSDVPVGAGTLEGEHPFPPSWRMDAYRVNNFPVLNQRSGEPLAPLSDVSGQELMATTLAGSNEPVTVLMTGPLSNLAWALERGPAVSDRIAEVIVMGGALEVAGNVNVPGHDGTAEWNVYWDPPAAGRVWDSEVPITLFSLDATDQVPVTEEFARAFGPQHRHPLSAAAGSLLALAAAWERIDEDGLPFCCWDSLATSSLGRPDLCTYREVRCEIVLEGPSEGRTLLSRDGRPVRAADVVDAGGFYAHCLETLRG
jgi:purine nucleosidase